VPRTKYTREPKKEGAGKYNEGSVQDEIADATKGRDFRTTAEEEGAPATEAKAEATEAVAEAATEPADASAASAQASEPAAPQAAPVKSLEEFLASRPKPESDLAIRIRDAENDETQFKPSKEIVKAVENNPYAVASASADDEDADAEEEGKSKKDKGKSKKDKAKHISLAEFTATANGSTRGRGGRGPRPGSRMGGGPRAPVVSEKEFPTLGREGGEVKHA